MTNSSSQFIETLCRSVPAVGHNLDGLRAGWKPEDPPITLIFACLGAGIADQFAAMPGDVKRGVFSLIEEGMNSRDDELSGAVATGLIEALVSKSDKAPGLFRHLEQLFGPASAEHARAWRGFGSGEQ